MTDLLIGLGLEPVVFGPWISALGWSLVHFLWQGALIGGLFAAGRWLLREGRPQHRYWLGLAALTTMAAAPLATFFLMLETSGSLSISGQTSLLVWSEPTVNAVVASAGLSASALAVSLEQMLPWIVGIWALGVLFMSTRVGIHWVRMLRLSTVGTLEITDELLARVDNLKQAMGVHRAVRVVETTVAQVPTVLGWLKPVILLPTSTILGLTPGQLDLVIAHELGHIRRLDYLINLFQIALETLLFYHPMVRWVSRCVRDERETCCDDLVVATCGNRLQYAKALANLESMRGGSLEPALAATGGQLVQRIERIVCTHRQRETSSVNSGVLFLIVGGLVLAAQLADPMGVFEERRSRLADTLVADLMAERSLGDESYAPLSDARIVPADNPRIEIGDFSASRLTAETPTVMKGAARSVTPPAPLSPEEGPIATISVATNSSPVAAIELASTQPLGTSPEPSFTAADVKPWSPPVAPPVTYGKAVSTPKPMPKPQAVREVATLEPAQKPAAALSTQSAESDLNLAKVESLPSGPVAIRQMSPDYPVRARISGQEGYVSLEFSIDYDGRVNDVRVVDSWPRRVFDRSAKRAIKGWRFDPTTVTTSERLTQRFDFTLLQSQKPGIVRDACMPLTGTRICRHDSPTSLLAEAANLN